MVKTASRLGVALAAFVSVWLVASLVAASLFGSGNILVWVFAAVAGIGVYVVLTRRGRRVASVEGR